MRRYLIILVVAGLLLPGLNVFSVENKNYPTEEQIVNYRNRLEKILNTNIIPFWVSRSIDKTYGGFILNHDMTGKQKKEPANKMIVSQARMVWFFSRLVNTKRGSEECLLAAKQGYKFLKDKMWDKNHGGFYWRVNDTGDEVVNANKHMMGQAYGLYAVAEYALASKDEEARKLADTIFDLWEKYAYDRRNGGYVEIFLPDWSPAPENVRGEGDLDVPNSFKLMNTHLHILEALSVYYRVSPRPLVWERLLELIRIQSNTVVRKTIGVCTDKYASDWTPILTERYSGVLYGHQVENLWLLAEACNTLGISNYLLLDLYRTFFNYSIQYGFDSVNGGFFFSGAINAPARSQVKVWWVQSEGLIASLYMFELTGDPKFLALFDKTFNWIEKHQVDWENGEWFGYIRPDGTCVGSKADEWKEAYHTGRAMIECLTTLERIFPQNKLPSHPQNNSTQLF